MKRIVVLHPGEGTERADIRLGAHVVALHRIGYDNDFDRARAAVAEHDGSVDAIGIEGLPLRLRLGGAEVLYEPGQRLCDTARTTPVVDGSGVRSLLERWAVRRLHREQPGILGDRRVLMVPGLNHTGLASGLQPIVASLQYADPFLFFGLPRLPGVGSAWSVDSVAAPTLGRLAKVDPERLKARFDPVTGRRERALIRGAQVLAGDVGRIRQIRPGLLRHKTVVVESATPDDIEALRRARVRLVVVLMPALDPEAPLSRFSAATVEALLAACRPDPALPLNDDTYLDLIGETDWRPEARFLQPSDENVNRFAFVIHPLSIDFIHRHPLFRWTRHLPDPLVEWVSARIPPMYISRIRGARSSATGQRVEGHLITLGATPRQMMKLPPRFTYRKLVRASHMAEQRGARLMGLGAFTSVVGDAGVTVARQARIAVTSGNSLTVSATLEAAKVAARSMGLSGGRAMVIGATGSIGSVCARMLAQATKDIVLVSIEPEKLIDLKTLIREETPGARVSVATRSHGLVGNCDVIVTATSGFGQRILDISECKPGAIICDVARPPDISTAEAALRPDVLVIESGEVIIPGDVDFGYDIGLPPGVSYACLAETALLAMDGRFESYTLGRNIEIDRVKTIYRLFKHHGFRLAGLRSLGRYLTDEEIADKRRLADELRADRELFLRKQQEAAERLARIPRMSKGVRSGAALSRAAG